MYKIAGQFNLKIIKIYKFRNLIVFLVFKYVFFVLNSISFYGIVGTSEVNK